MHIELESKPTIGNILAALRTEGVKTGDVAKQIEGIRSVKGTNPYIT